MAKFTVKKLITEKNGETQQVIDELRKHRYIPMPDVAEAEKSIFIENHAVNDETIRKDKLVLVDSGDGDEAKAGLDDNTINVNGEKKDKKKTRIEKVNRVAVAIQQLIIKRVVSFTFGNPPRYNCTPADDNEKAVMTALNRILYDVKSSSLNRKIGRSVFGYKEVAEYWYVDESETAHNRYGFPTKNKLKCAIFSPSKGDKLYPFFDETGDMVAFSREFSRRTESSDMTEKSYFETYTATEHYLWIHGDNGFELVDGYPKDNAIPKIPIVYGHQDEFETKVIDKLVDRLETLLSNFADTNDYHAAPKIFTTGEIKSFGKKGDSGTVIEGEDGATMQYVSWQNAPESVKLEIETLLKLIYTLTQTPDISFDSVKGLNLSGVALKLLFMDAHLKVQDKREIFDEYLQRRVNIILAYIAKFNPKLEKACENIEIEPEIIPYMINDDRADLEYWMVANGNQPVVSQEESIEKVGLSSDPQKTLEKITSETNARNTFAFGEPTLDA